MRAVIQRVQSAHVTTKEQTVGGIQQGLLVFLGVGQEDSEEDAAYMVEKVVNLRIFSDKQGRMNLSVKDIEGKLLVVSQFTLYGDCRRGRRPSYSSAAPPDKAQQLYALFVQQVSDRGLHVEEGVFAAHMQVALVNDGPVTLLLDSEKTF